MTPIDAATNIPGVPIPVGDNPRELAITPDGSTVYVANSFSGTVTPIDTATNTPGAPIPGFAAPFGMAIRPAAPVIPPQCPAVPDQPGDDGYGDQDHGDGEDHDGGEDHGGEPTPPVPLPAVAARVR